MNKIFKWSIWCLLVITIGENVLAMRGYQCAVHLPVPLQGYIWTDPGDSFKDIEIPTVNNRIWPNNQRASRPAVALSREHKVLIVGDSWTYGMGVKDDFTYPWLLNELVPDYQFDNAAVPGYGTVQALYNEEHFLQKYKYDWVFYALITKHIEERNTTQRISIASEKTVSMPWVEVDKSTPNPTLIYHIAHDIYWPADHISRIIQFIKSGYLIAYQDYKAKSFVSSDDDYLATCLLLKKMQNLAKEHGARFVLISLDHAYEIMKKRGFISKYPQNSYVLEDDQYIWNVCPPESMIGEDNEIKRDYATRDSQIQGTHPNVKVQKFFANTIATLFKQAIATR